MSFQNGIGHEAIIQSIVGNEKVIGGTTTQASNILGPGHIMNHGALPSLSLIHISEPTRPY